MIYPMYALHTLNAIPCYPRYFIVHLGSLHLDLLTLDLLSVRKVEDLIFDVCSQQAHIFFTRNLAPSRTQLGQLVLTLAVRRVTCSAFEALAAVVLLLHFTGEV
jgi:hypothetical protein